MSSSENVVPVVTENNTEKKARKANQKKENKTMTTKNGKKSATKNSKTTENTEMKPYNYDAIKRFRAKKAERMAVVIPEATKALEEQAAAEIAKLGDLATEQIKAAVHAAIVSKKNIAEKAVEIYKVMFPRTRTPKYTKSEKALRYFDKKFAAIWKLMQKKGYNPEEYKALFILGFEAFWNRMFAVAVPEEIAKCPEENKVE